MDYFFTPLSVAEAGCEDNGDLWEVKPGALNDCVWICTCHKDDWQGIALALAAAPRIRQLEAAVAALSAAYDNARGVIEFSRPSAAEIIQEAMQNVK